MQGHFLKISPLKKILEFQNWRKDYKPEIKPMMENLQDELYQLENKQVEGAKLRVNMRWELEGKKCSKTFFEVLERENLQN